MPQFFKCTEQWSSVHTATVFAPINNNSFEMLYENFQIIFTLPELFDGSQEIHEDEKSVYQPKVKRKRKIKDEPIDVSVEEGNLIFFT